MGCATQTNARSQKVHIQRYHLQKVQSITNGTSGLIWLCRSSTSSQLYALKEMNFFIEKAQDMFQKEVAILTKLKQNGLQRQVTMLASDTYHHPKFGNQGRILLQLGQATLLNEFNSRQFSEKEVLTTLRDVTKSLTELHQIGITHFDIKLENVILVGDKYKLCDLGSALTENVDFGKLSKKEKKSFEKYITHNSTLIYNAPQMIEPAGKIVGTPVDIWMLGCVAYILTFGVHPFKEKRSSLRNWRVHYPQQGFMTELIQGMMEVDPSKRLSAPDVLRRLQNRLKQ